MTDNLTPPWCSLNPQGSVTFETLWMDFNRCKKNQMLYYFKTKLLLVLILSLCSKTGLDHVTVKSNKAGLYYHRLSSEVDITCLRFVSCF